MKIYCVGCDKEIEPTITTGKEIYPHRQDLFDKQFLKCKVCGNYKSFNGKDKPTLIPTAELRNARRKIHAILDPLWQSGKIKRGQAYAYITHRIGYQYHNESLRSIDEARKAYKIVAKLHNKLFKEQTQ